MTLTSPGGVPGGGRKPDLPSATPGRAVVLVAVAVAVVVALVVSCTVPSDDRTAPAPPERERAQPQPQRPVVDLTFDVADDLSTVHGHETVTFVPDAPICEIVLRMWPNKPTTVAGGSGMWLTAAAVDSEPVKPSVSAAGAPSSAPDGTLVELPLEPCRDAGELVRADLGFEVRLGPDADERMGYSPSEQVAWFATAFPLLSWVSGEGWTRDDAVVMGGETATSEDFRLSLAVTAPVGRRVLATGRPVGADSDGERATHRFTADAVRDVAVGVGDYDVLVRDVRGVRVSIGTPASGARVEPGQWASTIEGALTELQQLLGPYPYPELTVMIAPPQSDGIEFPGVVQLGDVRHRGVRSLVVHELAHQWFYALVGNNQARHPWLDEAFTTYAQAVVTDQEESFRLGDIPRGVRGHLGEPMSYWAERGGFERYEQGVYNQGAALLLAARRRVGPDRFDPALRNYIQTNAHRVAKPADVAAAFADMPEVLDLLDDYGALA